MKVILDDERIAVQEGWTVVRSSQHFQTLVEFYHDQITVISFDHDLGHASESGKWCLEWLVMKVLDDSSYLPNIKEIIAHSANTDGRRNIYLYAVDATKNVTGLLDVYVTDLSATTDAGKRLVIMPSDFNYLSREEVN